MTLTWRETMMWTEGPVLSRSSSRPWLTQGALRNRRGSAHLVALGVMLLFSLLPGPLQGGNTKVTHARITM